jgi:hypothetical protein
MMAIDGTWQRACAIKEIAQGGATLALETPSDGISLKEFFLLLSAPGLAYRRCQLEGVNGSDVSVSFLKPNDKRK